MRNRSEWLEALARHAAQRPSCAAIAQVSPDGAITQAATWRELLSLAEERAGTLAKALCPGATVVAALSPGIDFVAWFAGAIASGVRLVLMHPRCGAGEFASVCGRTCAGGVLAADSLLTRVPAGLVRLHDHRPSRPGVEVSDERSPIPPRAPGCVVLGSSGTTGLPKLVVRESAALDAVARAVATGMSLTTVDRVLCVPPLCHSYGVDLLLGTLWAGATLAVMPEFDPTGAARQLASGATVLPGVPFMFESLAHLAGGEGTQDRGARPAHGLRLAVSAGSPLSPRVRAEFVARWHIDVGQLYGATELGTVSLSIPGEPGFDAKGVGAPLAGASFRVVDVGDPRRELASGEEGQLAVRAASMLSGYVEGEPELVDGHLLTGDLARLDGQGRATITGRLKLLIDVGGFKVNPLEVERELAEHPEVVECAVVAMPLSDTIQRVAAIVVPRDPGRPPGETELRRFLRERLAPIKIPRSFEMAESLPRSPLGKLLRDKLLGERV
ncbi:MAG: fatty acid--CoA ligase family protein [Planctomycetota bacterium]